jgi:membrane associated rhomboid family serine protease
MNQFYNRRSVFGFSIMPPVIKYLLIANVAIFILQNIFFTALWVGSTNLDLLFTKLFALQPVLTGNLVKSQISGAFYPWQLITYMFLHGGFWHLFFNMFALWMFGIELENMWGSKMFAFYYGICGIGAAIANLFISPLFTYAAPTIGASGAIFGILVAFGYLFPDRYIYIYFFIPLKAKYLVIIYMGLEMYAAISSQQTGIAHIAHLGGAVVGIVYLIITQKKPLSFFKSTGKSKFNINSIFKNKSSGYGSGAGTSTWTPPPKFSGAKDAKYTEVKEESKYETDMKKEQKDLQERVDTILDKLGKGGYQSLTDEEKRILFQDSKKLR